MGRILLVLAIISILFCCAIFNIFSDEFIVRGPIERNESNPVGVIVSHQKKHATSEVQGSDQAKFGKNESVANRDIFSGMNNSVVKFDARQTLTVPFPLASLFSSPSPVKMHNYYGPLIPIRNTTHRDYPNVSLSGSMHLVDLVFNGSKRKKFECTRNEPLDADSSHLKAGLNFSWCQSSSREPSSDQPTETIKNVIAEKYFPKCARYIIAEHDSNGLGHRAKCVAFAANLALEFGFRLALRYQSRLIYHVSFYHASRL